MHKRTAGLFSLALTAGLTALSNPAATAAPSIGAPGHEPGTAAASDALPNPLADKQNALRQEAIRRVVNGEATPEVVNGTLVVKVGEEADATRADASRRAQRRDDQQDGADQYVQLSRERTEKIFVVLAEFGNERHPLYPDQDTSATTPGPVVFDGPLHNRIPAPDRSVDNRTIWAPDYNPDHYRNLYFGRGAGVQSLKTYYQRQSSGRYSVDGMVTDWVKVRYNEARYGRSNGYPCTGNVCANTWDLVRDALDQWVADRKAAGETDASIAAELASFDQQDRYDFDGDANFDEPDGYIDHFQIVHAGGDQADGDPYQAEDAIWSHRWYAFQGDIGDTGPPDNPLGGTQVGATGLWVGDYTIQPENGGLSVFAHEYGHDLGLPDLYDTQAAGDNGVEWWSLMAQSRVSARQDEGIGTRAADLGAWEKLQLGWLDYEVVGPGQQRTIELGPHEYNSANAQAVAVVLPQKEVTSSLPEPAEGEQSWWSGTGNDYNATMTREVPLPAEPATLAFQANYNIEDCGPDPCDYAFVEVDTGTGWQAIPGSITEPAEDNGIDGDSGGWVPATFDLSAYAGTTIDLRVRYSTDGSVEGQNPDRAPGIFLDAITISAGGVAVFTDGAETSPNGWDLDGFAAVGTTVTELFDHYYLASNRQYVSYDRYLRPGPYNFGFPDRPRFVEHFPYQDGLLVSYWDTSYGDNNTSAHPGAGLILPVDAHPQAIYNLDGTPWRGRIQVYDATFGLEKADSFTLHNQVTGNASYIRGQDAVPVFDDTNPDAYVDPVLQPRIGVRVAGVGVQIGVLEQSGTSMLVAVTGGP